ncbi:hypothetical protein [Candidatus Methanoliparum sp. LAM-1]|uniref:hypothetical protein n=1 Tax=Candidatus Methanoliparum sp. LAM-1 TaxID=2874846 RepID=UPI001E537031|nr:hypothetical protein [Candidatus Methanoliparum sp. LAM-1]BDC35812.1 hypothetical protein MTLP_04940 [Candidatus Methanoliparum sp. LAM-1]
MDLSVFKKVKYTSSLILILGTLLSFIVGLSLGLLFGWNLMTAAFLGAMLVSTSTMLLTWYPLGVKYYSQ